MYRFQIAVAGCVLLTLSIKLMSGCQMAQSDTSVRAAQMNDRQATLAEIAMVPIGHSSMVTTGIVERADASEATILSETQMRSLAGQAGEFLWRYYGQEDPAVYIEWRDASGMTIVSREQIREGGIHMLAYTYATGSEPPMSWSPYDCYKAVWHEKRNRPENRVIAIANDSRGIVIAAGRSDVPGETYYSEFNGELGHAGSVCCGIRWWDTVPPYFDRIQAGETPLNAIIAIIVECEDGTRRPLHLDFMYDESRRRWQLISACFRHASDGMQHPWNPHI